MRSFLTLLLLCCTSILFAQKTKLEGRVINNGKPVEGAVITVKSSKNGTATASDGTFTVTIATLDELEVSSIGFSTKKVKVNNATKNLTITLETSEVELKEVVLVGSRKGGRVKTDSPVPVDVINVNQTGQTTAKPDLMSQLNMAVPSFNYNKQSGADGSDAIDFASLRGLGFDQTLVLVNGKRRHLSAFVNELGTRGRGNSGTDLNAIPEASIDRIEILRDGASAQYGSDAIAGVINIILKKDVNHLSINTGWSGYDDHKYNTLNNVDPSQYYTGSRIDGKTFTLSLNDGFSIGKNGGFINIGANFLDQGKTFRALPDTNWSTNNMALSTDAWRRAFGDASVTTGGAMFNAELPIAGTKTSFYTFGGYNYKNSNAYAWTRNFYADPQKFPTNADGSLIFDPSIMKQTKGGDVFYNPQEVAHITDVSYAAGFKGTTKNDWDWDFSNVVGYNDFHYYGKNTYNVTLNNALPLSSIKTGFDDGGFNFLQNTTNLDFSKHFDGVANGLTLAFGGEYRYEHYKLYAGEPDSYGYNVANKLYPNLYGDGYEDSLRKPASGSQGFPGFTPGDAADASRTNVGAYVNATIDITKDWLADVAARFENYSDFGFVNTYKLASRYKVSTDFNIRGSISTGFRAPTLQQLNFSNTNTNVQKINGIPSLVYVKLVPNYSSIASAVGIPKLKQETSVNYSLGFTWKPAKNFTVTVDGYLIQMKNRIVITGNYGTSIAALQNVLPNNNPPLFAANFFVNAVNTTNTGLDIVLDYSKHWGHNGFKALLAGNIQNVNIDNINVPTDLGTSYADQQAFFSSREQAFLVASAPHAKFSLALEYSYKDFAVGTHLTYFGRLTTKGFGNSSLDGAAANGPGGAGISDQFSGWDPYTAKDDGTGAVPENFIFHGKVTTDLYASYKLTKQISWTLGADNIFNVHPDLAVTEGAHKSSWGDSESGGPFDAVQMGFNGLRLFTKLAFNF